MAKTRTIVINGCEFELANRKHSDAMFKSDFVANDVLAIYGVYKRPSSYKVAIWRSLCEWARECGAKLYIHSHNCNFFSILGSVEFEGDYYVLSITARHYRAYKVEDHVG